MKSVKMKFILRPLLWVVLTLLGSLSSYANLTTDGSLGAATSLLGPDFAVTSDLGQQRGNILYHSFSVFDLSVGESATFSGPASISNIIVRISGGSGTVLDGLLRSTIAGANVYIFNNAGFLMGGSFSSDISGSYNYSGTATALEFSDFSQFRVTPLGGEILTTATPSGFLVPTLTISGFPSSATQGDTFNHTFTTSNFLGAVTPSLTGDVPPGLSISGSNITGTPTTVGTYTFTLNATDGVNSDSEILNLEITNRPSLSLTNFPSQILLGENIEAPFTTSHFSGTVSMSLTGAVPDGLVLSGSQIAGVPTAAGSYTFSLVASDGSHTASVTRTLEVVDFAHNEIINVFQRATTISLIRYQLDPDGILQEPFTNTLSTRLPSGFRIKDNILMGSFQSTGAYNFSITSQSGNDQVIHNFVFTVVEPTSTPLITGATINGVTTQAIILSSPTHATAADIEAMNISIPLNLYSVIGLGFDFIKDPYSWVLISGKLPEGLMLNGETGEIFGIPSATGTFSFVVSVKDWRGRGYLTIHLTIE